MCDLEPLIKRWESGIENQRLQFFESPSISPTGISGDLNINEQNYKAILEAIRNSFNNVHQASNPSGNARTKGPDDDIDLKTFNARTFTGETGSLPKGSISLLGAALFATSRDQALEKHAGELWPIVIPAVLNALDECESSNDRIKTSLVVAQLALGHGSRLASSGLRSAFFDAVCIGLLILPPSETPEVSEKVISASLYSAILLSVVSEKSSANEEANEKLLHKLIRDGPLRALTHANSHMSFTCAILKWLRLLIVKLGPASVAHTHAIIAATTAILSDPFGDLKEAQPNMDLAEECLVLLLDRCKEHAEKYKFDISLALARANRLDGECSQAIFAAYTDGPEIIEALKRAKCSDTRAVKITK